MPRGHWLRIGLEVFLLLFLSVACGTAEWALPRYSSAIPLPAPGPQATPAPPWPLTVPTPAVPWGGLPPFVQPTPTPTAGPPTPRPTATPLPTPTPFIPLEALRKTPTPPTVVMGHGIQLPPGFRVNAYAHGLDSVSHLAYSPDGVLFASLPRHGAVVALPDADGQGEADSLSVFAQGLASPSGLAFHGDGLYVAEAHQVVRFPYQPGQLTAPGPPQVVVPGLPVGSGHLNHAIGFGPDGRLYVAVGSSCNACREVDYRRAKMMRYNADGGQEEVFAQGLRDVESFLWYPGSLQMLATNCNRRYMGEDLPPDTIEMIVQGANYGWPFCHAGDIPDPELGWPDACEGVQPPFLQLPAHSTPRSMVVYAAGQFPPEYHGDIFVALYGSWERQVPAGYKIVRLDVAEGRVQAIEDFASGWVVHAQPWGHPTGLAVAPDGSLMVSDERAGAVLRITYNEE